MNLLSLLAGLVMIVKGFMRWFSDWTKKAEGARAAEQAHLKTVKSALEEALEIEARPKPTDMRSAVERLRVNSDQRGNRLPDPGKGNPGQR